MVPTVKNPRSSAATIPREASCCVFTLRTLDRTVAGEVVCEAEVMVDAIDLGFLATLMTGWK